MQIKTLQYQNVKGRTATHQLGAVTVFLGQNASGKSAALEALDIAMLGYSLRAGKTNADMFRLSSGPFMQSSITMHDGRTATRRLERRGDSVKGTESGIIEFPKIMRDSSLYFGLSPAARVTMVAGLVKTGEQPGFSVPEILASIKNIRLENNTATSEAAILRAYNQLAEAPLKGSGLF